MKFHKNYQRNTWSKPLSNFPPSKTQPEHADQSDINNIMARYSRTGLLPISQVAPTFRDLSLSSDFESIQDKLLLARRAFISLPFEIRDEFMTAENLLKAFSTKTGQARLKALGVIETQSSASQAGSGVQTQGSTDGGKSTQESSAT